MDRHHSGRGRFQTTQWTLVQAAQKGSGSESSHALAALCQAYWYPVYAFVRRLGHNREEAEDLTQGFFALLIEKDYLQDVRRERGKFRSFLLAAVQHFLANQRRRQLALKRGGGQALLSLDFPGAAERFRMEPAHDFTPEKAFERNWALALLEQAFSVLREEMARSGKEERFEHLQGYLVGGAEPDLHYRQVAGRLNMSENAVKATVHRMRRRFGQLLRLAVCDTLSDPTLAEQEVSHLLRAVRM